jgi:hypothetical protein
MRVARFAKVILAFAVLTTSTVGSSRMSYLDSAEAQQPADAQQTVPVTALEREEILRDMRVMLKSLNLILHGLARGDLDMVEQAARTSGNAGAVGLDLAKRLPTNFVELDGKVHTRFDQLADAIKAGRAGDPLKRLAALTGYCVACHDMYRLGEAR